MAKPINNGSAGSSSLGRSLSYNGETDVLINMKSGFQVDPNASSTFTKSNDFLYITDAVSDDYTVPTVYWDGDSWENRSFDGLGGSDQIIFTQDNLTIADDYFTNFSSFEVVKLAIDLDSDSDGSSITLGEQAFEAGIREVTGGNDNDVITFVADYDGVSVKVDGGAGNDIITTAGGNDTLTGGSGNDTLTGGSGNDTLTGGAGNDTFNVNAGTDSVTDLATGDILVVSAGATANAVLAGAFTATASTSNAGTANLTSAGFNVDLALATGSVGYSVTNTGGPATFIGSSFADTLIGGANNDTLTGGAGADNITPGSGTDTIVYTDITNEGGDTITNFTTFIDTAVYAAGADVLQFSEADLVGLSGFADYTGGGTSIDIDGNNSGSLFVEFVSGTGVQVATTTEAAFLFNQTTGELSFDADGTGAGGAIVIATLTGVTDLAAADFTFVA